MRYVSEKADLANRGSLCFGQRNPPVGEAFRTFESHSVPACVLGLVAGNPLASNPPAVCEMADVVCNPLGVNPICYVVHVRPPLGYTEL